MQFKSFPREWTAASGLRPRKEYLFGVIKRQAPSHDAYALDSEPFFKINFTLYDWESTSYNKVLRLMVKGMWIHGYVYLFCVLLSFIID